MTFEILFVLLALLGMVIALVLDKMRPGMVLFSVVVLLEQLTLYMKLSEGTIPATKPGKRYCLYRDELDKWLESSRKNPVPLSDEELNESISSAHRRKPGQRNW